MRGAAVEGAVAQKSRGPQAPAARIPLCGGPEARELGAGVPPLRGRGPGPALRTHQHPGVAKLAGVRYCPGAGASRSVGEAIAEGAEVPGARAPTGGAGAARAPASGAAAQPSRSDSERERSRAEGPGEQRERCVWGIKKAPSFRMELFF
jgi:hypothetical protein